MNLSQDISWKHHLRGTLVLALPVCFSNMGHILVDLADNYFIGQLPEKAKTTGLAAVSISAALYTLILVLAIGVSYGLTPIVAEANAQGKKENIIVHLRHAFLLNLITTSLLFCVLFFAAPLLHYTDKPADVVDLAIRYLNVIMLSMIPLSFFFTFKQFAEGMSDTKAAMFITITANVINVILNWALVFGHLGLPRMGVMGACWATFVARVFMADAMPLYIFFNPRYREFRPAFRIRKFSFAPVKEQLRIGIPSGLMFSMEVAAFGVPTLFIPGVAQLAAHRISLTLAAMTYMISSGLGAAATVRVGHFLGLKNTTAMRRAGLSAVFLAVAFMSCCAVLFILFRQQLPAIFNNDPDVLKYAAPLLLVAAAFQLFDGTQVTAQGALRGLKDTMIPGVIAFVAYWIVGLPSSWYFCTQLHLGAQGVWYGYVLGLATAAAGFLWRFRRMSRVRVVDVNA